MIITISGPPGSGKTTVARLLAERLGYEFLSTGIIFRNMADDRGMSLAEFGGLATSDPGIDKELDRRIVIEARKSGNLVLEGRLAGHMLHLNGILAFKVWIDAMLETRVDRIAGRESKDKAVVRSESVEREALEHKRYKEIYGIDSRSLAVYDLVMHSDDMTPEQIAGMIISEAGLDE